MNNQLVLFAHAFLLLFAGSCATKELKFFAETDRDTVEVKIRKKAEHSISDIAHVAFGKSSPYNVAVIKASDTVGSTEKAVSKMEIKKNSWSDYRMKNGSLIYYYRSGR